MYYDKYVMETYIKVSFEILCVPYAKESVIIFLPPEPDWSHQIQNITGRLCCIPEIPEIPVTLCQLLLIVCIIIVDIGNKVVLVTVSQEGVFLDILESSEISQVYPPD